MGSKRDNGIVLSIIIVSYKTRELLDMCLDSIFRAGFGKEIEVIVVDNGSVDGSVELVREKHPNVLLIANEENKGFSVANNQGIARSMGEMVLLLNPDTEVNREALSGMMDFMRQHPQVGVAGPQLLFKDGSPQTSWFHFPIPLSRFFERRGGYRKVAHALLGLRFKTDEVTENGARRVDIVKGACMMVRRQALQDVGLLEETRFCIATTSTGASARHERAGRRIFFPLLKSSTSAGRAQVRSHS